ncbi:hypothetical protein BC832DRAFT_541517 [Gaertneriomyces semiglobifer]|nr:hypothetical protein BC832DRAFT_541517 [Gaertneriomyces semiglobifer]
MSSRTDEGSMAAASENLVMPVAGLSEDEAAGNGEEGHLSERRRDSATIFDDCRMPKDESSSDDDGDENALVEKRVRLYVLEKLRKGAFDVKRQADMVLPYRKRITASGIREIARHPFDDPGVRTGPRLGFHENTLDGPQASLEADADWLEAPSAKSREVDHRVFPESLFFWVTDLSSQTTRTIPMPLRLMTMRATTWQTELRAVFESELEEKAISGTYAQGYGIFRAEATTLLRRAVTSDCPKYFSAEPYPYSNSALSIYDTLVIIALTMHYNYAIYMHDCESLPHVNEVDDQARLGIIRGACCRVTIHALAEDDSDKDTFQLSGFHYGNGYVVTASHAYQNASKTKITLTDSRLRGSGSFGKEEFSVDRRKFRVLHDGESVNGDVPDVLLLSCAELRDQNTPISHIRTYADEFTNINYLVWATVPDTDGDHGSVEPIEVILQDKLGTWLPLWVFQGSIWPGCCGALVTDINYFPFGVVVAGDRDSKSGLVYPFLSCFVEDVTNQVKRESNDLRNVLFSFQTLEGEVNNAKWRSEKAWLNIQMPAESSLILKLLDDKFNDEKYRSAVENDFGDLYLAAAIVGEGNDFCALGSWELYAKCQRRRGGEKMTKARPMLDGKGLKVFEKGQEVWIRAELATAKSRRVNGRTRELALKLWEAGNGDWQYIAGLHEGGIGNPKKGIPPDPFPHVTLEDRNGTYHVQFAKVNGNFFIRNITTGDDVKKS